MTLPAQAVIYTPPPEHPHLSATDTGLLEAVARGHARALQPSRARPGLPPEFPKCPLFRAIFVPPVGQEDAICWCGQSGVEE